MKIKTIYCLKDGSSKFGEMEFPFENGNFSTNAIGKLTSMFPATGICFRETPPDYKFSWHVAPQRQFIINLDAAVEVTTSEGVTNVFENGEIFFVEDIYGKGHFSKSVDNKPRRYMYYFYVIVSIMKTDGDFISLLIFNKNHIFYNSRSVFITVPDSFPDDTPEVKCNYVT